MLKQTALGQGLEHCHHSRKFPCNSSQSIATPHTQGQPLSHKYQHRVDLLVEMYVNGIILCAFLYLVSFAQHDALCLRYIHVAK